MKSKLVLGIILLSVFCGRTQAQCQVITSTNYVESNSMAVNSTGTDLIQTVVVDGSASMHMQTGCPDSIVTQFNNNKQYITHFPYVTNSIGSVGGTSGGPTFCAECYSSYQTSTDSGPLQQGATVQGQASGEIDCSMAGLIFFTKDPHTYSIRLSAYIFNGLSNARCTWVPTCAGKCSTQYTTNTFNGLCYTTGPFRQCFDLLRDGICWGYRAFCYGKSAPGICTN